MRRLNAETGQPFKLGFVREDGKLFFKYRLDKPKEKDGFYKELWVSEAQFKSWKHKGALRAQTPYGRANRLVHAAKTRGPVSITEDWVQHKIEYGFCEVSGLPFDLAPPNKFTKNPYSPSLDRIDSLNKEYSEENTRVVLSCINDALSQFGLEHFLKIAKAVIANQGNRNDV